MRNPFLVRRFAALSLLLLVPWAGYACGGDDDGLVDPGDEDVVGAEGGTLSFQGGAVVLDFPADAVASDLRVSVEPATGPADDLLVPGTTYALGPDGTTFAVPVTLTVGYDPTDLPDGVREGELGIFRVTGDAWVAVDGSTANPSGNSVVAPLTGFSDYGILAAAVASVTVSPSPAAVAVGGTLQLAALRESAAGDELPDRAVAWSSADESVVTVSPGGLVTGVAEGATTVTASSEGVEGSVTVTVTQPVAEVVVEPTESELAVGETVQLTATTRAADGSDLGRDVVWASSAEGVATVDQEGEVTAVAEGGATISATSEGIVGEAVVTVTNAAASVEVTADVQGIVAGGTTELDLTVRNAAGDVIESPAVTWSSSDEAVATVSAEGVVTTLLPGTVTLTATVDGVEGSVDLTVTIDWNDFAGTWTGDWTNTTFSSTGAVEAVVTIDVAALTATMIIDVDGQVFGIQDPMPMTITGVLTPTTMMVDHDAPLHGQIVFDLAPGEFSLESVSVPAEGFESWTYDGTNTSTTHTGDFTIQFTGGGSAQGVVELTKQEG